MRSVPVLLVFAFALSPLGCPTDPGDAGVVIPDDDDATDDDDDVTDDDDDGDDDSGEADDDDSGDDDDSAPQLCLPDVVLGQLCALTQTTTLDLSTTFDSCPAGDHVFEAAGTWASFLSSCGGVTDPIPGNDWATTAVAGFVRGGTGCTAQAQVLWVAECGGRAHLGEAFLACGDCEAEVSRAAFLTVPRVLLPFDSRPACVPDSMTCD